MKTLRRCPLLVLSLLLLAGLAALSAYLPDQEYSQLENRPLAQAPALDVHSYRSGQAMRRWDEYVDDQLALREPLMMLNAVKDTLLLRTQRQGIVLLRNGHMADAADNLTRGALPANISAMEALAAATDLPVTLLHIPLPSQVYHQYLPPYYPHTDVAALLAPMGDSAIQAVDTLPALMAAKGETYYRTDHHLTALGARAALGALLEAWGLLPSPEPARTLTSPDFYGSFFARAPDPWMGGDTLTFDLYDGLALYVDGEQKPGLYDPDLLARRNKYAALMYNNPPELLLENPSGRGTLLVLRDSYASAMLPALATHFARVIAVDPRFYTGDLLTLCREQQVERILCIYGINALLTDRNLPRLAAAW